MKKKKIKKLSFKKMITQSIIARQPSIALIKIKLIDKLPKMIKTILKTS